MDEVWAEIPNYPGYAVSNLGRVLNTKLNRLMEGQPHGDRVRVSIKHADGYHHYYSIETLMNMVDFTRVDEPIRVRKIKIVDTGVIYDKVEDVAEALLTDTSSVYRALRGSRPRVMGKTVKYVYE